MRPCVWVGLPVPVLLSPDGALCADLATALEEASAVGGAAEGAAARRQVALGLAFIGTAVAERGCSHDLARAALAEAATMRAHYTVGLLLRLYRHVPYLDLDLNHHFDALAAAGDRVGAGGADGGGGGGDWDGDSAASSDDDTESGENCTSGSSDGDKDAVPAHWSYGDRFDARVRVKGAAAWTATDVWQTFVNALDPVTLLIIISMLRRLDMRVPRCAAAS